ncbi:hypothetical protein [Phenylobacterium sp.]|uniref:hypothetical protein n=1 Tax=Phenylobacterium sp. TaxID=1871053 RepID=UPI002D7E776E|nr:hypothetical protein [Phenylobacterium sp.]
MFVLVLIFLVAVLAFGVYQTYRGLKFGRVLSRYGDWSRKEYPLLFWVLFSVYASASLAALISLAAIVLPSG